MVAAQSRYKSVWDALEADPVQAQSLKLRSALMIEINEYCSNGVIPAKDVIERLCIDTGRLIDLQNGRLERFGLDELVDMTHRLGLKVSMEIV